jgi:hypothetical protein
MPLLPPPSVARVPHAAVKWVPHPRLVTDTCETFGILELLDQHTNVTHMVHKRVWPTAQRDSCFVSHIRSVNEKRWLVQNISVDHAGAPSVRRSSPALACVMAISCQMGTPGWDVQDKFVRLTCKVLLVGDTVLREGCKEPKSRADVACKVTYLAAVNPGGWAPLSVVRCATVPRLRVSGGRKARRHQALTAQVVGRGRVGGVGPSRNASIPNSSRTWSTIARTSTRGFR